MKINFQRILKRKKCLVVTKHLLVVEMSGLALSEASIFGWHGVTGPRIQADPTYVKTSLTIYDAGWRPDVLLTTRIAKAMQRWGVVFHLISII